MAGTSNARVLLVTPSRFFGECLQRLLLEINGIDHVEIALSPQAAKGLLEANSWAGIVLDLASAPSNFDLVEGLIPTRAAPALVLCDCNLEEDAAEFCGATSQLLAVEDASVEHFHRAVVELLGLERADSPECHEKGVSGAALSRRELEVLTMVELGRSNREIAAALHISLHTVKNHVHRILGKLVARNRHEAARLARTKMRKSPVAARSR